MRISYLKLATFFAFLVIWVADTTASAETASPANSTTTVQSDLDSSEPSENGTAAWTLVDHNGRDVNEDNFRGRFRLMVFGYTFCPDVCPTALGDVAEVMDRLGDQARYVVPVFVTIDPNRDTPVVLAEYVTNFHPSTVGLTGTEEQIKSIRSAYGVISIPGPKSEDGTYFLAHSALKYLVGPDGEPIESFSHDDPPEVLVVYLKKLFQRMGV